MQERLINTYIFSDILILFGIPMMLNADQHTLIFLQVTYQSDNFLDKNKDYVVAEHRDLLGVSKCSFVAGLFPSPPEESSKSSKSSKFSSIGARFKVNKSIIAFFFIFKE